MVLRLGRERAMIAATLLLAGLLTGCVSLGGKPPKQLIGLTATSTAPAGAMAGGPIAGALLVIDPVADRRIDVARVTVQVDETRIAYLKDAAWVERPPRLFRRLLAETIRAKGKRFVLEGNDDEAGTKSVLSGRLIEFGYDARSQSAVVRYDALREDGKGTIQTQRFEAVERGVLPDAASVAPALNRAANRVAAQVADWVE
jgi:cholesterol transport system auxiliary component